MTTSKTKSDRFEMTMPLWLKDRVRKAAEKKKISMSQYTNDAVKKQVEEDK